MVLDTTGERITPKRLRAGLRTSTAASMLGMFWVAVAFGVPTTMFMEVLGASGVMIGAVVTVQQLAMVMQIPAAFFAERLRTRKLFWAIAACGHRLIWLLPPLLPMVFKHDLEQAARWMLVIVAASAILGHTVTASWMSWMADLVPDTMKGRFWGRRQTATMITYLLGTALVGWLLDHFPDPSVHGGSFAGFAIAFTAAAILGTADILVHALVPEPKPEYNPTASSLWRRLLLPMQQRDFRWLTLAMGAWAFSLGLMGSFGMIYLKRQFHATYLELTALAVAASIGTAAAGPVWGRMMDRIGPRTFGGIMLCIAPMFGLAWFLIGDSQIVLNWGDWRLAMPQPIFILFFSSLIAGAFYSGVALCQFNMAGMLAPRQGRTVAMAVHWTLVGLMGALGPIIGGQIMDLLIAHPWALKLPSGIDFSFVHLLVVAHGLVVWLVALPLFTRIHKRPEGEISLRTLVGNPLRAVGVVQNIMAMDTADPRTRVRAAQNLGAGKVADAASAIIPHLDDALPEVREAAADALGRIGTPDAVDALLQKLDDPESDLEGVIIRALRGNRDPRMVQPLLRHLRAGDRMTKAESARTLGGSGHLQAAPELLEMLRHEDDPRLAFAYAEGLVKMGAAEVLPELITLKNRAETVAGRRSMALLMADFLGNQQRFYELMMAEDKEPGSMVPLILAKLRRTGRRIANAGSIVTDMTVQAESHYDDAKYDKLLLNLEELTTHLIPALADIEVKFDIPHATQLVMTEGNLPIIGWKWFMNYVTHGPGVVVRGVDQLDALLALHFLAEWQNARS